MNINTHINNITTFKTKLLKHSNMQPLNIQTCLYVCLFFVLKSIIVDIYNIFYYLVYLCCVLIGVDRWDKICLILYMSMYVF